jgi:hypothetical protein
MIREIRATVKQARRDIAQLYEWSVALLQYALAEIGYQFKQRK